MSSYTMGSSASSLSRSRSSSCSESSLGGSEGMLSCSDALPILLLCQAAFPRTYLYAARVGRADLGSSSEVRAPITIFQCMLLVLATLASRNLALLFAASAKEAIQVAERSAAA